MLFVISAIFIALFKMFSFWGSLGQDSSSVISVIIIFFGPKYSVAMQKFKVSRWPVNLLVSFLAPFAIVLILPKSLLYMKINLSDSPKFLCPRITHFVVIDRIMEVSLRFLIFQGFLFEIFVDGDH